MNTGLVDQMWADVKRRVPKTITARNKEGNCNNLLWCYAYQWWLRTSISSLTARRQKLYKEWSHQCKWKKKANVILTYSLKWTRRDIYIYIYHHTAMNLLVFCLKRTPKAQYMPVAFPLFQCWQVADHTKDQGNDAKDQWHCCQTTTLSTRTTIWKPKKPLPWKGTRQSHFCVCILIFWRSDLA